MTVIYNEIYNSDRNIYNKICNRHHYIYNQMYNSDSNI